MTEKESGPSYFRCFVCGLQMEPALDPTDGDDSSTPILHGSHWTTSGQYGCQIYDSERLARGGKPANLEIVICDWCVIERQDRAREFKHGKATRAALGKPDLGPRPD